MCRVEAENECPYLDGDDRSGRRRWRRLFVV